VQGRADESYLDPYLTTYYLPHGRTLTISLVDNRPNVQGQPAQIVDGRLTWASGSVQLFIDPLTGSPALHGTTQSPPVAVHGVATAPPAGALSARVVWHVGSAAGGASSLPEWACAVLLNIAEQWRPRGGLHLYSTALKVTTTHRLLSHAAERLPRVLAAHRLPVRG
jgi:hypothetical protein